LSHKGSSGMSTATVPDVCLTPAPPGPPVPVPYPNIALNTDLTGGTTTVFADGGNMIAIRGSQLARSSGDEPGVAGGVTSGVNMSHTDWMTWSMDVSMDGANACRLSDKQFHNQHNTVNMGGQMEAPLPKGVADAELEFLCKLVCACVEGPETSATGGRAFQACVEQMLQANASAKDMPGYRGQQFPNVTPEQGYDPPRDGNPPMPRSDGKTGYRAPDSMIKIDPNKPATQDNIKLLVEMKFAAPGYCDVYSDKQQQRDKEIVGPGNESKIVVLTPAKCGCPPPPGKGDGFTDTRYAKCEEDADEAAPAKENTAPGVEFFTALGLVAVAAVVGVVGWLGEMLGLGAEGAGAGAGAGGGLAPPIAPPVEPPIPIGPPAPPAPPIAPPVEPPIPIRPPAPPAPVEPPVGKAAQNDPTGPMTDPAGVPGLAPAPSAAA
jgi:hypothetical protein